MDLKLFRVLDAIHNQDGINSAARARHLTQPAITHSLNRLRVLFGDPLFMRQGNRVVSTRKARSMMDDVQHHLRSLQTTTQRQVAFLPDALDMTLTVGFRDVRESIVFLALLARFAPLAPNVRIASQRIAAADIEREPSAGSIHLLVDRRGAGMANLSRKLRLEESMVIALRRAHPLASGVLRKSDYLAAAHVALPQLGKNSPLDVLLAQDGRSRNIRLMCQHYFSACQIAAAGDLLLTMPRAYTASF